MNFELPIMEEFISFLRFVEFDEDIEVLYEIEDEWHAEYSEEIGHSATFLANEVPFISKRNERKVWMRIRKMSLDALARYPQTFEED